jgi:hypothetical protein
VVFEVELAFEGLVDRLDPLADSAEVAVAVGLVFAVRTEQGRPMASVIFELRAGESLVGEQDLPGTDEVVVVLLSSMRSRRGGRWSISC